MKEALTRGAFQRIATAVEYCQYGQNRSDYNRIF